MKVKQDIGECVSLTVSAAVATLTLNRPEAYNALNLEMAAALHRHAARIEADDSVRVLVIEGSGRGFCAGGDIAFVASRLDDLPAAVGGFMEEFIAFLETLTRMPQIVVAAVHGTVAGAGLSLAMMADLCVAADDTRFLPAYAKLGVTPDCGGTIGVVRAVGVRKALQLFLMEDQLDASQAQLFGLVNRIFPASEFRDGVRALADRLAEFGPQVLAPTKRLLAQASVTPLRKQMQDEMAALLSCMQTPAYRDAVRQFVDK